MHPVTPIKPWQSLKRAEILLCSGFLLFIAPITGSFWQNSHRKRWNSSSSGLCSRMKTSVKESTKFPVIRTNLLEMQRKRFHIFDKTRYIIDFEEDPSLQSVLLCRPPHFGKSTVIDMLRRYHGSAYKSTIQEAFKVLHFFALNNLILIIIQGLHVSNPDVQKMVPPSRWLVLDFDFSNIQGHDEEAACCFYSRILYSLEKFWKLHRTHLNLPPCPFTGEMPGPWSNVNDAFNKTFYLVWEYLHENGRNSIDGVSNYPC